MLKNNVSENVISKIMKEIEQDGIQKIVVGAVIPFNHLSPLLVQRASDDFMGGLVELPSGTVDKGETLIEALVREVQEETGLTLSSIDSFIGTFDYLSGSGKKTRQVNFKARTTDLQVVLSPEHEAFFTYSVLSPEFNKLNISSHTKRTIENAFSGHVWQNFKDGLAHS